MAGPKVNDANHHTATPNPTLPMERASSKTSAKITHLEYEEIFYIANVVVADADLDTPTRRNHVHHAI